MFIYLKRLISSKFVRVKAFPMYGGIGVSAPSLHRESTDSLIHAHTQIQMYIVRVCEHMQERSVQADAGGVLEQVKRKQSDMQHYMKLVTTLKELREHRREAHRKTGIHTV